MGKEWHIRNSLHIAHTALVPLTDMDIVDEREVRGEIRELMDKIHELFMSYRPL